MQIISHLIDSIFPPRNNELLVRGCNSLPKNHCVTQNVYCLSSFTEPTVRAAITENKFHHNRKATGLLADLLADWLEAHSTDTVLIPVPLSRARQKERGYNQVLEVLSALKCTDKLILSDVLLRSHHTRPQTDLTKTQRQQNVNGAFQVKNTEALQCLEVDTLILIDDVLTTGATIEAARAALAPHLPPHLQLTCIALAH